MYQWLGEFDLQSDCGEFDPRRLHLNLIRMIRTEEEILKLENPIKVSDVVLHTLSKLYLICENKKMARWMNMNPYYKLVPKNSVPQSYFAKGLN